MKGISEILIERKKQHGDFTIHSDISQAIKKIAYNSSGFKKFSNIEKEAMEMIIHKMSRLLCGANDKEDSWRDISGYSELGRTNGQIK